MPFSIVARGVSTIRREHAIALTPIWRPVYPDSTSDTDVAGRDERIGYDICGGLQT